MISPLPGSLGYPSDVAQSGYYPGDIAITKEELAAIGEVLVNDYGIGQENTRVKKTQAGYEVLIASVDTDKKLPTLYTNPHVTFTWEDHAKTLERIVEYFTKASAHVDNPAQAKYIEEYRQHFLTGNLELHKDSQRTWVKDCKPAVEMMFGFVELHRIHMELGPSLKG